MDYIRWGIKKEDVDKRIKELKEERRERVRRGNLLAFSLISFSSAIIMIIVLMWLWRGI